MRYSKIKVYSTTTCPYCRMTADWLTGKKIPFEEIHVDRDQKEAMAMVEKTGQMGVPVTEIQYTDKRTEFVIGFNPDQLSYMLGV